MIKSKIITLSVTISTLASVIVFSVLGVNESVFASEYQEKTTTEAKSYQTDLFNNAVITYKNTAKINQFDENNEHIIQLLDRNNNVLAAEVTNLQTLETMAVTRTGSEVIVEEKEKNNDGEYRQITEKYPLIVENSEKNGLDDLSNNLLRLKYTSWNYTNLAVGKNIFGSLVNIGIASLITFTAGVFGIATIAAEFLLEYMGAYGLSSGAAIASALDTSGNGWIGLYVREVWNDSWTVYHGTQHRTM